MEFSQYLRLIRKWLWLILAVALVLGVASYFINRSQPPVYAASTTISIGRYIDAPNPDSNQIRTGIDLAQTYAQLVRTYDVLQATVDSLNLPISAERLGSLIDVNIIGGTSLLVITVRYTDPNLVVQMANGLAEQLIIQSPTNLTEEQQQQLDFANTQVRALDTQIRESRDQLQNINTQLLAATEQELINRLTVQKNILVEQINQASATIAQFTNTIVSLQQRNNSLDIVEAARGPSVVSETNSLRVGLLGAMVGAALAFGLALFLEYNNTTIRTTEEAAQSLSLPVLGAISPIGKRGDSPASRLISLQPTISPVAEAYRSLRTNLLFSDGNAKTGVYVVTSPGPEEGKSVTAANLAISMAHAGRQVLLIDADLRRPKLHELFGLENNVGLTTLLLADPGVPDEGRLGDELSEGRLPNNLKPCFQRTGVKGLRVITSGFVPPNPSELLGSVMMQRWLAAFRASPSIDLVIFDTPPALTIADSSVLAANVKADVVLVIDRGRTHRNAALKTKEHLMRLGITIVGVVVNRVNPRDEGDFGYDYRYYTAAQQSFNQQQYNQPTQRRVRG